jgi:hypothetical protein
MTDRRNERAQRAERDAERRARRQAEEATERQQEERELRSDQLKESWRRNHPTEEDEGKGRPKGRRPA